MNLENITEGLVVKNYKEMCKLLGEEVKDGKSKTIQIKEWKRYFDYEKDGQKFIITEIFDEPLTKEDKRSRGNNNLYTSDIEILLLNYLALQPNNECEITKNNLFLMLGMCNDFCIDIKNRGKNSDIIPPDISDFQINNFLARTFDKMRKTIGSALNSLKKNYLISYEDITYLCSREYGKLKATKREEDIIRDIKYETMVEYGFKKISQVAFKKHKGNFWNAVNSRICEALECDSYYSTYNIRYNKNNINHRLKVIEDYVKKEHMQSLNSKIINYLNNDAIRRYDGRESKYKEALEKYSKEYIELYIWGEPNLAEIEKDFNKDYWRYPKNYIKTQQILADILIKL